MGLLEDSQPHVVAAALSAIQKVCEDSSACLSNDYANLLHEALPRLIAFFGHGDAGVRAMAVGALAHAPAHWALAITGIAGPSGGIADKPVGTVWFGWATPAAVWAERHHFSGDRAQVRQAAVRQALGGLVQRLTLD